LTNQSLFKSNLCNFNLIFWRTFYSYVLIESHALTSKALTGAKFYTLRKNREKNPNNPDPTTLIIAKVCLSRSKFIYPNSFRPPLPCPVYAISFPFLSRLHKNSNNISVSLVRPAHEKHCYYIQWWASDLKPCNADYVEIQIFSHSYRRCNLKLRNEVMCCCFKIHECESLRLVLALTQVE